MNNQEKDIVGKNDSFNLIQFETLAEDAPVMLWLTNEQGEIIFSNTKWRQFIGADKVEEQGGDAWYKALHEDDKKACMETYQAAFDEHKPFKMEYRLRRKDGEFRDVLDTGEPYISKEGKFSGFIGSSTDITERKRSEQQLQRSHSEMSQYNSEMRLINKLNSYLQVCRTIEETHPIIFYYTQKLFPSCSGSIYLFNESKVVVESIVTWGENSKAQLPVITPDDCWSLRQGKNHTVQETDNGLVCKHITKRPEHGYSCVPVIAQGDMVGMLHLQFPKPEPGLSDEDINRQSEARQRRIEMTADNIALALVSLKLKEALEKQSLRDPLTQLFNRRHMEDVLEREFSCSIRAEKELGLMMLDVDHFKKYNDNYGHEAGDLVLIELAKLISEKLRESDTACRYGGEEFIIIMPGAPLHVLEIRAKLIQKDLQNMQINYQGKLLDNITISVGISAFPFHGNSPKSLVKAADMALYEAKETGRNRVVIAQDLINRSGDKKAEIAKKSIQQSENDSEMA